MTQLLENFTITQILLFLIFLAFAFKECVDFIDWIKNKINNRDKNVKQHQDEKESQEERIAKLEESYEEITDTLDYLTNSIDLLIQSDRDDIKAYITREHHNLCYDKGWVDDYTLDCLEKRFRHYIEENGNSFIEQLMNEIRALPKQPVE